MPEEAIEIVSDTVKDFTETTGIVAGIILCTLRHFTESQSIQTVALVDKFISNNYCLGVDLTADEAGYPINNHIKAFRYAEKKVIPSAVHAGEARGAKSVWETIRNFKPQRIGHGVPSIDDPKLLEYLIENQIHLEVCPTCNVQTNVFENYSHHSIDYLYKKGI